MIKFKDLSGFLKATVICSWVVIGLYGLMFLIGLLEGIMYY
jgi:hypothetical protein